MYFIMTLSYCLSVHVLTSMASVAKALYIRIFLYNALFYGNECYVELLIIDNLLFTHVGAVPVQLPVF